MTEIDTIQILLMLVQTVVCSGSRAIADWPGSIQAFMKIISLEILKEELFHIFT